MRAAATRALSANAVLSQARFELEELDDPISVPKPARMGDLLLRGQDCKLQIAWSARDGGNRLLSGAAGCAERVRLIE